MSESVTPEEIAELERRITGRGCNCVPPKEAGTAHGYTCRDHAILKRLLDTIEQERERARRLEEALRETREAYAYVARWGPFGPSREQRLAKIDAALAEAKGEEGKTDGGM